MSVVEISVAHLKKEEKDLPKFLGSLKERLITAARKLLIMNTTMKFGLGVNATFTSTDDKKRCNQHSFNKTPVSEQ
jgi:hypothetical protein